MSIKPKAWPEDPEQLPRFVEDEFERYLLNDPMFSHLWQKFYKTSLLSHEQALKALAIVGFQNFNRLRLEQFPHIKPTPGHQL